MKRTIKLRNILEENKLIISIVVGLFISIALKLEFVKDTNFIVFSQRVIDIIYFIFIIGICYLNYNVAKIRNNRLWIISIIVGIIFAICYYLGDMQNLYIYSYIPTSKKFMLYSLIKLMSYFILFTNCVVMLFDKLPVLLSKFNTQKEWKFFTYNRKSIIVVALIFFASYIPFFLHYYPGNVNTDSVGSLLQITGVATFSNFQPIIYTFLLGILWNTGKAIFGSSVAGIALYTFFQMVCTSLVFSLILYYMAKRKVNFRWRIITFLFLLLNPINGWFVVRCEKGILFHLSLTLVILGIIDIIHEKNKFFEKKWKYIGFILITLIMVFIRNNGIYALLFTIPFLIWHCKDIRKSCAILFSSIFAVTLIVQGPIFKIAKINYSAPGEVLSIPMQQFARISKYDADRLSIEDTKIINKYFNANIEKLGADYVPWKADSTKANFNVEEFNKDKFGFLIQYFKFSIKFPVQTLSSLVFNTGINYSPNFNVWSLMRIFGTETEDAYGTVFKGNNDKFITQYPIEGNSIITIKALDILNKELLEGSIPFANMLIENIGVQFWIIVLCLAYCVYKKEYSNIVIIIPILAIFLTDIAAPMVDLRYIYAIFYVVPIFIGVILEDCKEKK